MISLAAKNTKVQIIYNEGSLNNEVISTFEKG